MHLIKDKKFFIWLIKIIYKVLNLENKELYYKSNNRKYKIKSFFVEKDEKENLISYSSRAMLNFGHTFGHALETMNNYNNKLTSWRGYIYWHGFCRKNFL